MDCPLGRKDIERQWLFERCREVQQNPDGYLDLWAREHYKSTIITFGKTIQDILVDANVTVGIFSHTRPIAKAFLRQIKRELESNEGLKELFPDILYANPQKESQKWSEDEGIIVKKGNKVVDSSDVDWESADLRQYSIYQPSGDGNALGDVKFVFPNKHSVYLHDTPKKSLFEESERLFSHGCVRLRNPLAFAQRILDADKGFGAVKVSDLALVLGRHQ